jgi:hypothetical protein
MKCCGRLLVITLLALALPPSALAGVIAGTIYDASGRGLADKSVSISCASLSYTDSVKTDGHGGYVFRVPGSGNCELKVDGAAQTIFAYEVPTQFSFVLTNGTLERR